MFGNLFGRKPQATHVEDQVWLSDAARCKLSCRGPAR